MGIHSNVVDYESISRFSFHGSNDVESSADHFYASNALNASKYDSLHYHVINDVIIMKHMSNKSL